jgi:hypothetical protein
MYNIEAAETSWDRGLLYSIRENEFDLPITLH